MKKLIVMLCILLLTLTGCTYTQPQVVATTLPVYEFTTVLCQGTDITVGRLVTESVSCLHDYTLKVSQMRMLEGAQLIVISGAGLEEFLEDVLEGRSCIDSSSGIDLHEGAHHEGHSHEADPHIWLSPSCAKAMVENICAGLAAAYPQHEAQFGANLALLLERLDALETYGKEMLADLRCRELVTFHDGFCSFAESFGLTVLQAVEEESGSEASAAELKQLCTLVRTHELPAVFTERSGSTAAAEVIANETGTAVYTLDMAMAGDSYFDAMYHNIDTVKEALG